MRRKPLIAAAGAGRFDWARLMALGLGLLRLPPRRFWSLSLIEFAHVCGLIPVSPPGLDRAGLQSLMRLFPDEQKGPGQWKTPARR